MVDWNGLFKWSMNHQDGTKPSQFKQMSVEDRKWLEAAFKAYTFNDADRLREVCAELKKHEEIEPATLVDMIEEVQDLVELHPRNNLNMCLCGGMETIIQIILNNPSKEVRRTACGVFSAVVQNNTKVQEIAKALGAINLMHQYLREDDDKNKEAVLGALSAFLRAENFIGKKEFLQDLEGISFLKSILQNKQNLTIRLLKKVVFLLNDLVVNDDSIFGKENPTYVRKAVSEDPEFVSYLLEYLIEPDVENTQKIDVREFILRIFEYLVNYKHELLDQVSPPLWILESHIIDKMTKVSTDV